jgi:hypothetical protein
MSFVKLGEMIEINGIENPASCIPEVSADVLEAFQKTAANLKRIAPKADDFLYFSAVMMHAAEAAAINDDGSPKLTSRGEPVQVGWNTTGGTMRWVTNDPSVMPYKNANCFKAGTKILMFDGSTKSIEDIEVGDRVFTHKGRIRTVLATNKRHHDGKLLKIKVKNNETLFCTAEHPLFHVNLDDYGTRGGLKYVNRRRKSDPNYVPTYKFSEAGKLDDADILVSPIIRQRVDYEPTNESYVPRSSGQFEEDYVLHPILNIEEIDFSGDVYNFEVEEDHTYIANGVISHNCDIFPEDELIKAYKKWRHKPLCIDHKSSSVDHTRGFIVDTYYDRKLKRVVALCALDKANYPDLARKVSTGMQTSCSMGTGVSAAICTDCGKVARAESDFCHHMKTKSGYGEINTGLNPIELSIVVNGADPKAHIKHVIASADTMLAYVSSKEQEFKKLAGTYSANLSFAGDGQVSETGQIQIKSDSLESFKKDLDEAFSKLKLISDEAKKTEDTNSLASVEEFLGEPTEGLAPPVARFANELNNTINLIGAKLGMLRDSLNKLATGKQEENMSVSEKLTSKGYYQGTEEPTPGQVKYPKDPLNEESRNHNDKQMNGQSPFPGVGDVDGLHPSPMSADTSDELERKRLLARAAAEEKAIRRQAIVDMARRALEDKKAYWHNGEGVNPGTPTPGKVKYPKDPLNEKARNEDKQMVGQKPFPGVGDVDGLHPSPESADDKDELKRKEMLRRAGTLHGRFVRASKDNGTRDLDNSAWEIRLGDKLLLTASVKDLSGGRSELMFDTINTAEFGQKLIEKIKAQGADRVSSMLKSAQAAPPPPPAGDAPPPPDAGAPQEPPPPPEGGPKDTGKDGDKKDSALEKAEQMRDLSSDLVESVRELTGEQAEMGEPMGASAEDRQMHQIRKELNSSMISEMKQTIAQLNDLESELRTLADLRENGAVVASNRDFVSEVQASAEKDAKVALADGFELMRTFLKYAKATQEMVKAAEVQAELTALAQESVMEDEDVSGEDDLMSLIQDTNDDLDHVKELMDSDGDADESHESGDDETSDDTDLDGLGDLDLDLDRHSHEHDLGSEDENDLTAKPEELKDLSVKPGTTITVAAFDKAVKTKNGRDALRAKLAYDATGKEDDGGLRDMSKEKFSPMLDAAHKLADGEVDLDIKPTAPYGKFETVNETNKAMMELAKMPPKVRKEAQMIADLVKAGELDVADLDDLVANGADKAAVDYFKKFYGQVDGGAEFAAELTKEHVKAQMEKDLNTFKVKMARAYELTYDMVDRGLVKHDRAVIAANVDELMSFSEDNFQTLKNVCAKTPILKQAAARIPTVGLRDSMESHGAAVENDFDLLSAALSGSFKSRMF